MEISIKSMSYPMKMLTEPCKPICTAKTEGAALKVSGNVTITGNKTSDGAEMNVRVTSDTALALDGATHTAVLLDEKDEVIRPAIYWTDQRAVKEAREDMALPRRRGICAARSFPWTRSLPKIPSGNRKSRHRDMAQTGCLLDRK